MPKTFTWYVCLWIFVYITHVKNFVTVAHAYTQFGINLHMNIVWATIWLHCCIHLILYKTINLEWNEKMYYVYKISRRGHQAKTSNVKVIYIYIYLENLWCNSLSSYDIIWRHKMGQHYLEWWLVAWWHQTIIQPYVDLSSLTSNYNQLRAISQEQGKSEGFDCCDRPSNLKLDSNRWFFSPCDREI